MRFVLFKMVMCGCHFSVWVRSDQVLALQNKVQVQSFETYAFFSRLTVISGVHPVLAV